LYESEKHYRDLVENSLDLMCTHDLNGVLLTINLAAARTLGYEPGELVNRNLREFLSPEVRGEVDAYLVGLREKGASSGFMRLLTKSGDTRIWKYTNTVRTEGVEAPVVRGIAHDFTDIFEAQKALREGEERLRIAAEVGRMYAWEWDSATDLIHRSPECAGILGLDAGEQGSGEDYFILVHPDDRAGLWALSTSLTPKEPTYRTEYRRFRPDGALLWLEESGRGKFDESGKMIGLVGMTADITERKHVEEALRASEERSRVIVQKSPVAMLVVRGSEPQPELVKLANDKFTALFGYSIEEVPDIAHWWPLAYPDEAYRGTVRAEWQARVREAVKNRCEIAPMEAKVRCKDGSYRYIEFHFASLGETNLVSFVDLTDRKNAEEALRESEERLRLAVKAGRMYAFEWDTETDVVLRSEQSAEILNWIDEPTPDTDRQFISRVHPDDREAYVATETGLTPDNPAYQTTYRMLRPDGGVVWLEESGHAFFDGQGRMLRIIGMVTDVTDRKRAEEVLASVSRRLIEAQEQERTRIARELHDDIGQRLALLTIELEQLRQSSPDLSADLLHRISKLSSHSSDLATDVQSLSHELHSSKLEYLGIATAMSAFCKEFSDQQNVEVVFAHNEVPRTLPSEISLCLFRVLQEALQNALKHSGVRHFDVELCYGSDEIHLTVRDSGAGFESEVAKKSRGLGLISMEERLKLLNGTFSIESRPKFGTTIHARVPLSKVARIGV
jgi:PAS domain S-box-containing protein